MDLSNVSAFTESHMVAVFVLAALGLIVAVKKGFGPANAL